MPVVAVSETQQVDPAGTLTDMYEVTFTITGRPGSFTVTVPKTGDPVGAVQAAIEQVDSRVQADLKWPNDLLLDGKKVCGILAEMNSEATRVRSPHPPDCTPRGVRRVVACRSGGACP